MTQRILITGGTGTLGREILQQLLEKGRAVSVLTSKSNPNLPLQAKIHQGNLTDQSTLHQPVSDVEVIIHCASNSLDPQHVDINGTKNLLSVIQKGKLKHFIYISIVGVDKSDFPYYKAKFEVEKMIETSGLPYTIVRATQFHDLVLNRIIRQADTGASRLVIPAHMRFQTIDIREVAAKVLSLADEGPANSTLSIGGPEVLSLEEMAETYLQIANKEMQIATNPDDTSFAAFKTGVNLCPDQKFGKISWRAHVQHVFKR